MTWDKMTPRERDVLVAEKVFGRQVENIRIDYIFRDTRDLVPHYTTDLNAAWQVVSQLPWVGWNGMIHLWGLSAQEAALAICKRALDAVGWKEQDDA